MRYSYRLNIIRKRKHTNKISLIFTLILLGLILTLGFSLLDAHRFFIGFVDSFVRVLIAYGIAMFLALIMSLTIAMLPKIESIAIPTLDALQSFPAFSIFPLLIIWFGKTAGVIIIILVFEMIWPILFSLLSSQKQIKGDLIEAANIFGAKGVKYISYVLIPLLWPAIITGSIVAWGEAWETVIAAEILVAIPGVGTYLSEAGLNNNSEVLIVGIFLLLTLLFILNKYLWLPLLNISTKYQQE